MATTSPAFPYKTWRAVDIRKKKHWLGQKGSAWSRRDNQSMRDRCCLALRSGKGFKFFLITIANVDLAGRMTFFPKTTFLHKTGALRNVVNETLRLRKLFLKMTTKIFLSIC